LKQKYETAVIKSGGQTPTWNQSFDIPIYSLDHILKVSCMDKDLIVNDTVGEVLIRVNALVKSSGKRSWMSIYYKKEYSGEILIESTWKPHKEDVFHEESGEE
jgi:Ca2+-dependent lipid-binding protein